MIYLVLFNNVFELIFGYVAKIQLSNILLVSNNTEFWYGLLLASTEKVQMLCTSSYNLC
jgi:hypothetical protein